MHQGASETLPQHRKTSPLIIIQSQPTATQLRLQHAVLLAEKGNHVALFSLEPPKQARQQHLQRNHGAHSNADEPGAIFGHYGIQLGARVSF